jgi:hypothetical protein
MTTEFVISTVDQAAQADFEAIENLIHLLREQRSQIARPPGEHPALDYLIDTFAEIAKNYFARGQELIGSPAPGERSRAYRQVLRRLTDHILLLGDIARPYNNSLVPNRSLIVKLLRTIAVRLDPAPFLIPRFSLDFRYINFTYAHGIGVIGMPPPILTIDQWATNRSSNWALGIGVLWHEVAGHIVAMAQHRGELAGWVEELNQWAKAEELTPVWPILQESYEKSLLSNAIAKIEIVEGQCRLTQCQEIIQFLQEPDWQEVWLGEFFEDLFGIQALGKIMVEALVGILLEQYEDAALGDAAHPPPNLRLAVALAFLESREGAEETRQARESITDRYGPELKLDELDAALQESAGVIADFCLTKIDSVFRAPAQFTPEEQMVAQVGETLTETIRNIRNELGQDYSQERIRSLSGRIFESLKTILKDVDEPTFAADTLTRPSGINEAITNAGTVDDLLAIQLTTLDFGRGNTQPPRIPR